MVLIKVRFLYTEWNVNLSLKAEMCMVLGFAKVKKEVKMEKRICKMLK